MKILSLINQITTFCKHFQELINRLQLYVTLKIEELKPRPYKEEGLCTFSVDRGMHLQARMGLIHFITLRLISATRSTTMKRKNTCKDNHGVIAGKRNAS